MRAVLEVKDLGVSYGRHTVLNGVSFRVEAGQWLMIAGPNGAGKSTILNAITQGVDYTGSVLFEGEDVKTMKAARRARRIAVLAQDHHVGYGFTVREIVGLGRYAHTQWLAGRREGDEQAVEEALVLTGMGEKGDRSVLTLSGGELQRTFLAQAFAQSPRLLLLDEPTNHLDLVYQKQVFTLIGQWLEQPGRAVVSVVHDLSLAKAFGTHGLLMNRGRAVSRGEIGAVLSPKNLDPVYGMDVGGWMRAMLAQWNKEDGHVEFS